MSAITETFLFTPPVLGNCYTWLDASTSNNFTFSSGSNISTWIDRSGNNYTVTATNSPTYDSVSERVRFASASSQSMQNTSSPLVLTQRSFFFVLEEITNSSVCGIMPIIPSPTTGTDYTATNGMTIEGTGGVYFYANGGGYANRATATVPMAKAIYSEVFSNPSGTTYINGTAGGTSNANYTPGTSAGYGLGGRWANGIQGPFFNGFMYEVLAFRRALSTTERQAVEGYLAWKWNLVTSLPANHPYKLTPVYANQPFPLISRVPNVTNVAVFDPRSFSGCQLWFDAADLSTILLSNTSVTQWNDKSTNRYRVLQTTAASRPTLTSSTLNGLYGIQLSQSTFLSNATNSMTNFTTGAATSVFMVTKNASTNTSWNIINTVWFTGSLGGTQRYHFSFNVGTTPGVGLYLNPTTTLVGQGATIAPSANAIIGFTASLSSTSINVNGSQSSFSGYTLTDANDATTFIFGDARNNVAASDTAIYEMVGYNRQLSRSEIQQVEGYFAWKWGLTANLPTNHPFSGRILAPFSYQERKGTMNFFSPRRLACTVWLDAADRSSMTINGTNVSQWNDKSGNGKNATTSTNFPVYAPASLNKLATLRFNGLAGTPTYIDLPSFSFGTSNRTAVFIIQSTAGASGSSSAPHFFFPGSGFTNSLSLAGWISANVQGAASGASFSASRNSYLILVYRFGITTGFEELFANGTSQASATKTSGGSSYSDATTGYRLGWLTNGDNTNTFYFDGNIGEVILFNKTLSNDERQQVEGYLAWKWGLQANLPSTHPFKLFPPSP